jgi:hypothetical protein
VCGYAGGDQGGNGIWPAGCSTYVRKQPTAAPGDVTGDRPPLVGFELYYSLLKLLFWVFKKTITIMAVVMMEWKEWESCVRFEILSPGFPAGRGGAYFAVASALPLQFRILWMVDNNAHDVALLLVGVLWTRGRHTGLVFLNCRYGQVTRLVVSVLGWLPVYRWLCAASVVEAANGVASHTSCCRTVLGVGRRRLLCPVAATAARPPRACSLPHRGHHSLVASAVFRFPL